MMGFCSQTQGPPYDLKNTRYTCELQFYYFFFWPQPKQHVPVILAVANEAKKGREKKEKSKRKKEKGKKLTEEILPLDTEYYKQIYIID